MTQGDPHGSRRPYGRTLTAAEARVFYDRFGAKQDAQQDVTRFESGVSFEFAAPIAIFVLGGEKMLARPSDGGSNAFSGIADLAKEHLARIGVVRRLGH